MAAPQWTSNVSMSTVNRKKLLDIRELQRWSVTQPHNFWIDLYRYLNIVPPLPNLTRRAYDNSIPFSKNPTFFPGHSLNYGERTLREQG